MPSRLERLRARRYDPTVARKALGEAYAALQEDDNVKFVIGAMQPIDPAYTEKSYEEGRRVGSQIKKAFDASTHVAPEFVFQGSVTSDTHIRAHSDIDLLVLEQKFVYLLPPLVSSAPYVGDPLGDLKWLRDQCAGLLSHAFPKVILDAKPGKAIRLSGGSLTRNVDVVIAAWLNTLEYAGHSDITERGVSVFDSATKEIINNFPFLHNLRIHEKDGRVNGNLRRTIRLLKTINADADREPDISSYDLTAISCAISDERLMVPMNGELMLLEVARRWLAELISNDELRNSLQVPNGTRKVFGPNGARLSGLEALKQEVDVIAREIEVGVVRKHRVLSEARVQLPGASYTYKPFDRGGLIFRG